MQRLHLSNFAAEIIEKEGRKEERKVEYSTYVSDLINASCNVTRCIFTCGKKGVTKPHLKADSARPYLPPSFFAFLASFFLYCWAFSRLHLVEKVFRKAVTILYV